MNHQDSGTIIVTFLLLLPWLGRCGIGRRGMARTHGSARQEAQQLLKSTFRVTSARS